MSKTEKITMLHGAGGSVMHDLVKNYIVKYFAGLGNDAEVPLEAMDDAAVIGEIVFKSDSHAVKPIFSQVETSGAYRSLAQLTIFHV
jgi:hydrogenase expression/formation protein HypE